MQQSIERMFAVGVRRDQFREEAIFHFLQPRVARARLKMPTRLDLNLAADDSMRLARRW